MIWRLPRHDAGASMDGLHSVCTRSALRVRKYMRDSRTRKIGRLLRDTLISFSIALAALFVTELVLRILYPEKVLEIAKERQKLQNLAFRFHPEYLVALKPNIIKTYKRTSVNGGNVIHWETNSDSFRGPELKPHTGLRVIVYGDSNIQARFSNFDQTFPARLQDYLTSLTRRDVEVVNGGVVGSGPDQVLIRFASEIDKYKPDVVIFHVFADNDFGDIIRNRLFELDAQGELVRTRFRPTVDQELQASTSRFLVVGAAAKVVRVVTGRREAKCPKAPEAWNIPDFLKHADKEYAVYRDRKPRKYSVFADEYDFDIAAHPDSQSATTKVALLDRILMRAKTIADHRGVSIVVLIQPSTRDLTQLRSINYQQLQQYPDYRRDRLTSSVQDICSRHKIHSVNLYPVFSTSNPETLFLKADDHWSDAGQELAARETADYIYRNKLWENRRYTDQPAGSSPAD